MTSLQDLLAGSPYVGYSYSYPHKTAYRPFDPPLPLRDVWADEDKSALFLYMHVPFCEMRCGFCNLFTTVNAGATLEAAYLDAFTRQARRVKAALGDDARFARLAIGGGTPTYLEAHDLARLFDIAGHLYGIDLAHVPISVETSPQTATAEKMRLLREHHVDRVSMGVQSFIEEEVRGVGRAQRTAEVFAAAEEIRRAGIPTMNLDLIYGLAYQTPESWRESLAAAVRLQAEEIYLYPLYTRPLTGLARTGKSWDDMRLDYYRAGRDYLLEQGYTQVSMRMFRAAHAPTQDAPIYCCQKDGMVGLGSGARSYTRTLHYSGEYAVGHSGVRAILSDYTQRSDADFDAVDYGATLDDEEQRRRYVIKSLLHAEGLSSAAYQRRFGETLAVVLPELAELETRGLAWQDGDTLRLTPAGYERSDVIGPWLYSAKTWELMGAYELQ